MKAVGVIGTEKIPPPNEEIREGVFSAEPYVLDVEQEPFQIDGRGMPGGNTSELSAHANIAKLSGVDDCTEVGCNPLNLSNKDVGDEGGIKKPLCGKDEEIQVAPKDEIQNVTVRSCSFFHRVGGNGAPCTSDLQRG
jgi:hypothetical protein